MVSNDRDICIKLNIYFPFRIANKLPAVAVSIEGLSNNMAMAIDELSAFFASVQLPKTINLSQGVKIINVPDLIDSHLNVLKVNGNIPEVSVFYERLVFIKDILLNRI